MKDTYCRCCFCAGSRSSLPNRMRHSQSLDSNLLHVKGHVTRAFKHSPTMMHSSREVLLQPGGAADSDAESTGSDLRDSGGSDLEGPVRGGSGYNSPVSGQSPGMSRRRLEDFCQPRNLLRSKECQTASMVIPVRQSTLTRDPFPELTSSPLTPTSPHIIMNSYALSTPSSSPTRCHADHSRSHPVSRSGSGYDLSMRSVSGYDLDSMSRMLELFGEEGQGSDSEVTTHKEQGNYETPWTPSTYKKQLMFFYVEDDSHSSLVIDPTMRSSEACHELVDRNHAREDINWVVVEHNPALQIERLVEDHEVLHNIHRHWANTQDGKFYLRKDFRKFEPFKTPGGVIPPDLLDKATLRDSGVSDLMPASDRYNHILLQHIFNYEQLPDIQGYCYIKDSKKCWKKHFTVLKPSGLYYSTKGTVKDQKHLVSLCSLNNSNIFLVLDAKKTFGAPHPHCICLKRDGVSELKNMVFLCVEEERQLSCWFTCLRLTKYGSQLREDYKSAINYVEKVATKESSLLNSEEAQRKQRVPMDFTGTTGRVVGDPSEACGVAYEETQQWRKKVSARKVVSPSDEVQRPSFVHTSAPTPTQCTQGLGAGVHMTQPWFYSGISRQQAVNFISKHGLIDGVFLVRESQSIADIFVLSLAHNHRVKHCQIQRVDVDGHKFYSLDGHTKFSDLIQLVEFYQLNAAGLPTRLTHYVTAAL